MPEIKERPILFSAPMVRAILEGRKTVTRRPLNERVLKNIGYGVQLGECHELPSEGPLHPNSIGYYNDFCPFGQPGDRLYVRETFMDLRGTGVEHRPDPDGPLQRYAYGADTRPGSHGDEARKDIGLKWTPSIHMPRAASRILLEITAVRVERLQDISDEQCTAEGVRAMRDDSGMLVGREGPGQYVTPWPTQKEAFRDIWETTGGDWNANPWVWAFEFKRVTP
ncbi:hypothetical protein PMI22_04229 [Pseudomonas sp. GM21]|jgi:hypothetical protein|uniref:hypothetical protein n=1 Tax=Pseudomonas sp. GM21 TaxID=1144325 RepID=UPI0002724DED|nr:hypothetical protein [Pseudomonas sp. GM21]EJM15497.1 hypothetical protein PMI22_04229 [Pseudomonas sp. GM21]